MIKNFICWLWGHNQVSRTWYSKWVNANHYVGGHTYERLPFCKRCGKPDREDLSLSLAKRAVIDAAIEKLDDIA
jgi:hypothetical protein